MKIADVADVLDRLNAMVAELDAACVHADNADRSTILIGLCHLQAAIDTFTGTFAHRAE